MKKDIENRADIELLVDTFYIKVKADTIIGHFFTEVVNLSWDVHIPIMYNFWEGVLLHTAAYKGNPMQAHIALDKKSAMAQAHFDRWLTLWDATVTELFDGPKATDAMQKAKSMAFLIHAKTIKSREEGFIQ